MLENCEDPVPKVHKDSNFVNGGIKQEDWFRCILCESDELWLLVNDFS